MGRTILRAIDHYKKHEFDPWDCPTIQSAIEGGARWLLSENLWGISAIVLIFSRRTNMVRSKAEP